MVINSVWTKRKCWWRYFKIVFAARCWSKTTGSFWRNRMRSLDFSYIWSSWILEVILDYPTIKIQENTHIDQTIVSTIGKTENLKVEDRVFLRWIQFFDLFYYNCFNVITNCFSSNLFSLFICLLVLLLRCSWTREYLTRSKSNSGSSNFSSIKPSTTYPSKQYAMYSARVSPYSQSMLPPWGVTIATIPTFPTISSSVAIPGEDLNNTECEQNAPGNILNNARYVFHLVYIEV